MKRIMLFLAGLFLNIGLYAAAEGDPYVPWYEKTEDYFRSPADDHAQLKVEQAAHSQIELWKMMEYGNPSPEGIRKLVRQGASLSFVHPFNGTILHHAIKYGQMEVVRLLIQLGAPVEARHIETGITPLFWAAIGGFPKITQILVDEGHANIEAKNSQGQTPLHGAARFLCKDVVAFLLSRGAQPDVVDAQGKTPFDLAAVAPGYNGDKRQVRTEIMEMLLGRELKPDEYPKAAAVADYDGLRRYQEAQNFWE
ncbi:ankyrin repeat domain-containing protein [Candidatus Babeliales bacterium]|nr:ankyrin repeat domain-containing protein [Candidatus Babeliales bacterium]